MVANETKGGKKCYFFALVTCEQMLKSSRSDQKVFQEKKNRMFGHLLRF